MEILIIVCSSYNALSGYYLPFKKILFQKIFNALSKITESVTLSCFFFEFRLK